MANSEFTVRWLEIERLKLLSAKARREQFGQSSERGKLLMEQLELAIEDLEETQGQPNNAAEGALRGVAVGRRSWTFAGSDAGGHRAAAVYTLIETCKMNDVDPASLAGRRPRSATQPSRQQSR